MGRSDNHSLTALFLAIILLGTVFVLVGGGTVSADLSDPGALSWRGPITILGDAEFTSGNGVVGGDGSASNPYIIENWTINALAYNGIKITNTQKHFVIRNCWVMGINMFNGIVIDTVQNGTIEHCKMNDTNNGLDIRDSSDIIVNHTNSTGNSRGIYLKDSFDIHIFNSTCYQNSGSGIDVDGGPGNIKIENCTVLGGGNGGISIYSIWTTNNAILNTTVRTNHIFGISIWANDGTLVSGCTLEDNGLALYYSKNCVIVNNTFTKGGVHIYGDVKNYWTSHTMNTSNKVNGKPLRYIKNTIGGSVSTDSGQIILANCSGMSIDNYTVEWATVGISVGYCDNISIDDVEARNNSFAGIYLYESQDCYLNDCYVWDNPTGYRIQRCRDSVLYVCYAVYSTDYGFYIDYSENSWLKNCYFYWGDTGMFNFHSENTTGISCASLDNVDKGFRDHSSGNSSYIDCYSSDDWAGIEIIYSNDCYVYNPDIWDGIYGIIVSYSSNVEIDYAGIINCLNVGIEMYGSDYVFVNNSGIHDCSYGMNIVWCTNVYLYNNNCSDGVEGIDIDVSDIVEIRECQFHDNQWDAVFVEDSTNITVRDSYMAENIGGIVLIQVKYADIINCTSNHNTFDGINILGYDIDITDCTLYSNDQYGISIKTFPWWDSFNVTVSGCTLSNNWDSGVYIADSQHNLLHDNTFVGNPYYGVHLVGANNNTIKDNLVEKGGSAWNGIFSERSHNNTLQNNTIRETRNDGIFLRNSHGNSIIENTCINVDGGDGIHVWESDNNLIQKNNCSFNIDSFDPSGIGIGILVDCSSNNTVSENICNNNSRGGIEVIGDSMDRADSNVIDDCVANYNGENGIRLIFASNTDIMNCIVKGNGGDGIELYRDCDSSMITNNRVEANEVHGLLLGSSDNCLVGYNVFFNNTECGVYIPDLSHIGAGYSDNCLIYYNCFIDNNRGLIQSYDWGTSNTWDLSGAGNYWYDYEWRYPNATNDGLVWDTPYDLYGAALAKDYFPLVRFPGDYDNPLITEDLSQEEATTGNLFTFKCVTTDNIIVKRVYASYWYGGGSFDPMQFNLTRIGQDGTFSGDITIHNDTIEKLYYQLVAVDTANNMFHTTVKTVNVTDNDLPWFIENFPKEGGTGDAFMFNVTAGDNVGLDAVSVSTQYYKPGVGYVIDTYELVFAQGYWLYKIVLPENVDSFMYYSVHAYDSSGNWNHSNSMIDFFDNDPPVPVISNFTSPIHPGTEVFFNATGSYDNIGIVNYTWDYTHPDQWGSFYGEEAWFTLNYVGDYNITLTVRDKEGNNGSMWMILTVEEFPDMEPPTILNISFQPMVEVYEEIRIMATVWDNVRPTAVTIDYFGINSTWMNGSFEQQLTNTQWAFFIPGQPDDGWVHFTIKAWDGGGNLVESDTLSVEVINTTVLPAPYVVSTDPDNNTDDAPLDTQISITFSESMDRSSVENAILITPNVGYSISWEEDNVAIIFFHNGLEYNTIYHVFVTDRAIDIYGTPMTEEHVLVFNTLEEYVEPVDDDDDDTRDKDRSLWWIAALSIIALVIFMIVAFLVISWRRKAAEEELVEEVKPKPRKKMKLRKEPKAEVKKPVPEEDDFLLVYSYYEFLDVPRDASMKDIKRAYRKKSKEVHPDACVDLSPKEQKEFKKAQIELNKAKETLLDEEKREKYDISIGFKTELDSLKGVDEAFGEELEKEEEWDDMVAEEMKQQAEDDEFPSDDDDDIDKFLEDTEDDLDFDDDFLEEDDEFDDDDFLD